MKWFFKILIFIFVLVVGNFGLKQLAILVKNKDNAVNIFLTQFYNSNTFKLDCDGIDAIHVDVRFASKELEHIDLVLIENGKLINQAPNVYGPQKIHVVLFDTLSFDIGHMKTNWWHQHKYLLKIELKGDKLTASFQIFGPNPEYYGVDFMDSYKNIFDPQ